MNKRIFIVVQVNFKLFKKSFLAVLVIFKKRILFVIKVNCPGPLNQNITPRTFLTLIPIFFEENFKEYL